MSIRKGQRPEPDFVNSLLSASFRAMEGRGDAVMRPFLQDVIQFDGLTRTLVSQLAAQPAAIPGILLHVGVGPLVDWIGHYARLGLYTAAHRLGRGVALGALPPRARLAAELKRDELKYGAGLDYEM